MSSDQLQEMRLKSANTKKKSFDVFWAKYKVYRQSKNLASCPKALIVEVPVMVSLKNGIRTKKIPKNKRLLVNSMRVFNLIGVLAS